LSRCAIYTRKSTEHNLDLAFTSLDAQREACEAYVRSQQQEGWRLLPERYDDGGLSGASLARPALQALLARFSHTTECIRAANQREPLCCNELSMICGGPDADRV
jgi:DNA invertase Pin-like site-specific DNA recombinase